MPDVKQKSEYICPTCGKDCKTIAGLKAHFNANKSHIPGFTDDESKKVQAQSAEKVKEPTDSTEEVLEEEEQRIFQSEEKPQTAETQPQGKTVDPIIQSIIERQEKIERDNKKILDTLNEITSRMMQMAQMKINPPNGNPAQNPNPGEVSEVLGRKPTPYDYATLLLRGIQEFKTGLSPRQPPPDVDSQAMQRALQNMKVGMEGVKMIVKDFFPFMKELEKIAKMASGSESTSEIKPEIKPAAKVSGGKFRHLEE